MTVKKRLQRYVDLKREVARLRLNVEEVREQMTSIKSASDFTGIQGGSGNADKIGLIVSKMACIEFKYIQAIETMVDEQNALEAILERLEPIERLLIRSKYIEGRSWEEVCCIINYSWAHTHRLHSRILSKLHNDIE